MIADRIIDLIAYFAADNDLFGPENCQMLRGIGLFDAELFNQLSRGQFALTLRARQSQRG